MIMKKRVTLFDVPEPLTLINGPIVTDRPPPIRQRGSARGSQTSSSDLGGLNLPVGRQTVS